MTFQPHALRVATLLALGAVLMPAHATNGYFSHGYGIKSKGMGGAGLALAQDAFAGANNPAQAAFAGDRMEAGLDLFMPDREMSRTGTAPPPMGIDISVQSDKKLFFVPEFGYNKTLSNDLSVGITVYGNGGMNSTYPGGQLTCMDPATMTPIPGANALCGMGQLGVDLTQLVVAPTIAYKLNANHSIGVSPLLVYQQFSAYGLHGFMGSTVNTAALTNNGHDDSTGLGIRLGYMGKFGNGVSVGASYSPKVNMSRFKDYAGLFADGGDFDIPENYGVGVAFQASPAVQVALDYNHISYDKVPAIGNASTVGPLGGSPGGGFGWKGVDVFKIGVQWAMNPTTTLRAGINHGTNPVTGANITPNILAPGVMKTHLTLGGTYAMNPKSELSWSFMYAPSVSVSGPSMLAGTETVKMRQMSIGMQYGMKF